MRLAVLCPKWPILSDFQVFLELKYEEQLSWSQTSQWDEISFTKRNFWGNNTHKFTHIHCWTADQRFSRPRQCVDDEADMRSSVQVVRITSGCRHSSSSAMLKVPSSYSVLPKKQAWCLLFYQRPKYHIYNWVFLHTWWIVCCHLWPLFWPSNI